MALKKDFYQALEDLLGPENVSQDPVITESYSFPIRAAAKGKQEYLPRFEAIALPKDTAEVQAILQLCNRFKVQFKASSTGWLYSDPAGPGCIKIDLRRMDRILEINEKNMYAVVEPYVIYAQLQAELMKRGLNCNITGAGANCSALPLAAHANLGHLSQSGSYGERNLLAFEWVTGDGEIIRMGSLGSSGEWFSGDGPGPSLRGIIRGNTVPLGGLWQYPTPDTVGSRASPYAVNLQSQKVALRHCWQAPQPAPHAGRARIILLPSGQPAAHLANPTHRLLSAGCCV